MRHFSSFAATPECPNVGTAPAGVIQSAAPTEAANTAAKSHAHEATKLREQPPSLIWTASSNGEPPSSSGCLTAIPLPTKLWYKSRNPCAWVCVWCVCVYRVKCHCRNYYPSSPQYRLFLISRNLCIESTLGDIWHFLVYAYIYVGSLEFMEAVLKKKKSHRQHRISLKKVLSKLIWSLLLPSMRIWNGSILLG